MSSLRDDVAATDELISALAQRRALPALSSDRATRSLECWVADLDYQLMSAGRRQLPELTWPLSEPTTSLVTEGTVSTALSRPPGDLRRPRSKGRILLAALAATAVLTISSTGLAAAVSGDPWPSGRLMEKIARLSQALSPNEHVPGHLHTRLPWGGDEIEHGDGGHYRPDAAPSGAPASSRAVLTAGRLPGSATAAPTQQGG